MSLSLQKVFEKQIKDEFPPKYVFCMFGNVPMSIKVSKLQDYVLKYKYTKHDSVYNLPILEVIL